MKRLPTTHVIQLGYGKVGGPLVQLTVENRTRIELETGVCLRYAAVIRSASSILGDDLALGAPTRDILRRVDTPRARHDPRRPGPRV